MGLQFFGVLLDKVGAALDRRVNIVEREIDEKRVIPKGLNQRHGFPRQMIGQVRLLVHIRMGQSSIGIVGLALFQGSTPSVGPGVARRSSPLATSEIELESLFVRIILGIITIAIRVVIPVPGGEVPLPEMGGPVT